MKTYSVLLVYPEIPATYWSFEYALPFTGHKTLMPPLGLLTIASLFPESFIPTLVDCNIQPLTDEDVQSADLVFISAMIVQKESFHQVVEMARKHSVPVVAGGPYPTSSWESIEGIDHFILNEGEITLPEFLKDFQNGNARHIYTSDEKPDLSRAPIPRYDLVDAGYYSSMALQTSRGCPFNCEFCDIIEMFGRVPRYKEPQQLIKELDLIFQTGHRGPTFIVDDNFIGNKSKVKALLREVAPWQEERGYPFAFYTEASIDLARDDELMDLMVLAGFNMVFVGIETPDIGTLKNISKNQNVSINMLDSINAIQKKGIEVMGGFILGFDTDTEDIFERQYQFIRESSIPMAMIGLMMALPNTRLYRRLQAEGRILGETHGNNTHSLDMNFVPVLPKETLVEGYKDIIRRLYSPREYFHRSLEMIKRFPRGRINPGLVMGVMGIRAFALSVKKQLFSPYGFTYLAFLLKVLWINYKELPLAVTLAIKGHHFFAITSDLLERDRVETAVKVLSQNFRDKLGKISEPASACTAMEYFGDTMMYNMKKELKRVNKNRQRELYAMVEEEMAKLEDERDRYRAEYCSEKSSEEMTPGYR